MRKFRSIWSAALCGLALLACSPVDARTERRVALVIGNAHYQNPSLVLSNPKNDAEDIAAALRGLGFEVIQGIDTDRRTLDLNMANFARLATNSDAALFYYAGHALQYQGRNYLMPVDSEVQDEVSLRYQLVAIDDVRAALERTSGVKVMILDACRNNPVVDMLRRRSFGESRAINASRGLARIDKTQGMVVAYSTSADDIAADGSGRNSPFTAALLKWLKEPGLEVEKLFRRIASDVNAATDGRQRPETYVSLLSDFYLNDSDRIAYDSIKDTTDPIALKSFVQKFPSSSYASVVISRLQAIEAAAEDRKLQQARLDEAARVIAQQRKAEAVQRQLDEQRAKLAAVEQERAEAAKRQQDEQRAKAAAAERERADREVAKRQQDEQRTKQAAADRERADHEAAQRQQGEQRAKAAAAERERADREAAQRQQDEQRARVSALDWQKSQGSSLSSGSSPASNGITITALEPAPQPDSSGVLASCESDQDRLARLRSSPSQDEIALFERELSCERLRPQLARLRESLSAGEPLPVLHKGGAASSAPLQRTQTAGSPPATQPVASRTDEKLAKPENVQSATQSPSDAQALTAEQVKACKRDEGRLTQLRAKPGISEIVEFERALECEKLRPQIVRLRESLPPVDAASVRGIEAAERDRARSEETSRAQPRAPASAQSCDQEKSSLARLRDRPTREQVVRFEQQLSCEDLRPQVLRLLESLLGG
jgi:uncharacterized caspase-like protein